MAHPLPIASDELLNAEEVATRLRVAKPTIYEWARTRPEVYGAVRIGPRKVRFRREAIDKLIGGAEVHAGA